MAKKPNPKTVRVYTPAMDWWVAAGIGILLLIMAGFMVLASWNASIVPRIIVALVICAAGISIIDKAFFTVYILTPDRLTIESQLRSISFSYRSMAKIRPGSFFSLFTRPQHKRFAVSRDCLVIEMAKNAPTWKSVSVSPQDRDGFLTELIHHIDEERSRRVAAKVE